MSRNPILNENAFGGSPPLQGTSPADEWAAAQSGVSSATQATWQAPQTSQPYSTTATKGRVMTLGG
ncbi:MAG TPA: hypothetical protein VL068_01310, partial [Microthrixaceae bacterium]|nr:hypothetical protein [Microthrixaceae bacterium]